LSRVETAIRACRMTAEGTKPTQDLMRIDIVSHLRHILCHAL
jgi:hypothetical protein